ncbi:MAG: dihydropteroate synthase [Bacteroidia bacterium]
MQGCNEKELYLSKPVAMGILNLTPDSFYDGGAYDLPERALAQAHALAQAGAKIIDLGACSTRPSAVYGQTGLASEAEEWQRLEPALRLIRSELKNVFLSIDTFRASIAEKAAKLGADIINDISGGSMDAQMDHILAEIGLPYILMHIQGTPQTMQENPQYEDVVQEVYAFLEKRIAALEKRGVRQIIIDPGFGFGKTIDHNYTLLRELNTFTKLGKPILAGFSRKSMIHRFLNIKPEESLNGTTVLHTLALEKGASILRVHDVREANEAIALWEKVNSF